MLGIEQRKKNLISKTNAQHKSYGSLQCSGKGFCWMQRLFCSSKSSHSAIFCLLEFTYFPSAQLSPVMSYHRDPRTTSETDYSFFPTEGWWSLPFHSYNVPREALELALKNKGLYKNSSFGYNYFPSWTHVIPPFTYLFPKKSRLECVFSTPFSSHLSKHNRKLNLSLNHSESQMSKKSLNLSSNMDGQIVLKNLINCLHRQSYERFNWDITNHTALCSSLGRWHGKDSLCFKPAVPKLLVLGNLYRF